jgi:hypothetical protein
MTGAKVGALLTGGLVTIGSHTVSYPLLTGLQALMHRLESYAFGSLFRGFCANLCNANSMFIREKRIGPYSYVYLVETVRENGRIKQRIIRNLGRKEAVEAAGDLDRLARSAAPAVASARWFFPQSRAAQARG